MYLTRQGSLGQVGQAVAGVVRAVLTFIGAAVIGVGIPAAWLRIGGLLESKSGKGGTTFLAIGVIFAGIIASYFVIIWATGLVAARRVDDQRPRRYNWNRSLRDEAHQAPKLNALESLFVWTAVLVGVAYMVWFFFFAGSSLPAG
jgi:hypothetical protein